MEFKEQMNMIFCNFNGMNFVALLQANVLEDQLTILFNLLIVEYPVSILWHQHDVVSDLTIAMAKTAQFQCYHILTIGGVAPPMAEVPRTSSFKRSNVLSI